VSSSFWFGAKNRSPAFGHSSGRKIIVSFTTTYAVPRQIKSWILELSIRRRQSNLSIAFIFVGCEEKDCYRVVSVGQLGLTTAHTAIKATVSVKQIIFSQFFSIFHSGGITKHLMTGPSGNSKFCFSSTLNIEGLGETKLTVPVGLVIKSLLSVDCVISQVLWKWLVIIAVQCNGKSTTAKLYSNVAFS